MPDGRTVPGWVRDHDGSGSTVCHRRGRLSDRLLGSYQFKVTVFTPTETQPNDTRSQAVDTGLGTWRFGTYTTVAAIGDVAVGNPSLDVDCFKVSLRAGERVIIDLDAAGLNPKSTLNSYLQLFDAAGNMFAFPLASNDDAPAPGEVTTTDSYLTFTARYSGVYYVGVSSSLNSFYAPEVASSGTEGSTGTYRLEIQITPGSDLHEPNDFTYQATDTGLYGQRGTYLTNGRISAPSEFPFPHLDTDIFRLDPSPGQLVTILTTPIPGFSGSLRPRIVLQNAFGVTLAESFGALLTHLATGYGPYYVIISGATPDSYGDYSLQVNVQQS